MGGRCRVEGRKNAGAQLRKCSDYAEIAVSLETARRVLEIEARALQEVKARLDNSFAKAVDVVFACKGRVAVTGMGKSGLIGRKISAPLSSTWTPPFFLHPADALHGDLGMLARGDAMLAVSYAGASAVISPTRMGATTPG